MVFRDEPERLHSLRTVRDAILNGDPGGTEYIALYYRYSSEIIDICNACLDIKEKTFEALKDLIPIIVLASEGRRKNLDSSITGELLSLLEKYAKGGSPGLRLAIKKIERGLKDGNLSSLLRFAEMEIAEKNIN